MIRTKPPLEDIETFYSGYQKSIKSLTTSLKKKGEDDNVYKLFGIVFDFIDNQSGMNVGIVRMIKQLSEMIDKHATKEEIQEKMQEIETKVSDTLIPLNDLVKQTKEIQERDNSDSYTK